MQTFIAVIFILSCHSVWRASVSVLASRAYVCEPHNSTQLTDCTNEHWIHISSEIYAPKLIGGSSCDVNLTGCNNFVQDLGLKANCNGPVTDESSPCQEEVDFEWVKFVQCLADADDLAAMLDYSCVPGTSVLDMCSSISHSQTSSSLYLASPGFPSSVADGQMCVCSIQGTRIKMEAIDVSVKANLQWEGPSSSDDVEAVLTLESGGTPVFDSNDYCPDCQDIRLHNTYILSELGGSTANISLSYSDFGLPDQNVWLRIFSLGPMLNITCSSHPLPSNRIITTTTTSTTTTTTAPPTTSTSTTVPPTTATTSTTTQNTMKSSHDPVIPVIERTQGPNLAPPTSQSTSATENTGPGRGNSSNKKKDDGGNDDTVLIVVLLLVMIILIAVTSVLCVVIYRRRDKFGSIHMKSAVLSWFERTFQSRHHAGESNDEQNDNEPQTYDDIIAASSDGLRMEDIRGKDVYAEPSKSSDGQKMEDFRGDDVYAVPNRRFKAKHEPEEVTAPEIGRTESGGALQKAELDAVGNEPDPGPLIDPGMYASHQELVSHEVARIKMERSLHSKNKTNDNMSKENKHHTNKENTRGPPVYAKQQGEGHVVANDQETKIKAKTHSNSDVGSHSAIQENKHRTDKENTRGPPVYAKQQGEGHDVDKDLETKIKAKTHSNSDISSRSAMPDELENKESNQERPDDVKMHYKKRKPHEKTHNKKARDDGVTDVKNTEKDCHANVLKLSPEEGQMFENLGIPQSSNMDDDKKLDENSEHHENKTKGVRPTDTSNENSLYREENDYSIV